MGDRAAKDALFDGFAEVARALASGRRVKAGTVVVLDVRPEPEHAAGHIRGARSVPVEQLRKHLRSLPTDTPVVAYCRGPYCVCADDAVRELQRKGFTAARLQDGHPEWKRAGLPTAVGVAE
jgi:rhodanese-related sulfurtransferase